MLTFPITFLLGDVINEYYGATATKNTVYLGLVMSILVFIIVNIAQALPYLDKGFNVTPEAFNMIFGSAKLMYIASIVAYLVGQLLDIWLFGIIKRVTKGRYVCLFYIHLCSIQFIHILYAHVNTYCMHRYLWLRATGSTVLSQMMDSFVVSYIAFRYDNLSIYVPGHLRSIILVYIYIHTYISTYVQAYSMILVYSYLPTLSTHVYTYAYLSYRYGKQVTHQTPATMAEVVEISVTGYGLKFVIAGMYTL